MALPYKSLRKIVPLASRAAPVAFYALGFVAAMVSTIYLATRYIDSLPGPSESEKKAAREGKSIDNRLRD